MEKTCLIIAGGDCFLPENKENYDYVIACDKGYEYAKKMGIRPDLVIGDFDSTKKPSDAMVKILEYPIEKDDTDTMLAVKYALEHGYKKITLCSVFGGRFDHTLANIQTAGYIAQAGGQAVLVDKGLRIQTVAGNKTIIGDGRAAGDEKGGKPGKLSLKKREHVHLSVFALTDVCKNVSINGAKYTMKKGELTNVFPLGVSNSFREPEVIVTVEEGILLVVEQEE